MFLTIKLNQIFNSSYMAISKTLVNGEWSYKLDVMGLLKLHLMVTGPTKYMGLFGLSSTFLFLFCVTLYAKHVFSWKKDLYLIRAREGACFSPKLSKACHYMHKDVQSS
ncbi:hypothetical protein KP509_21G067800 [Ceratopteris richardii]|uniref:Uncharacterized protein n=1 Tax=Ceratopteris richardii TaxID=49495 RepID=A0A8T2SBF4_CERRI|nr:hypothetical protein KP509_21G067800 [Ceratopteris richardii]